MNGTTLATETDIETDRQRQVAELVADSGGDWARDYLPGTSGCHELLDRTAMFVDMVERHLTSHPACLAIPEWHQLADQAASFLRELYQRIGAEHLSQDR